MCACARMWLRFTINRRNTCKSPTYNTDIRILYQIREKYKRGSNTERSLRRIVNLFSLHYCQTWVTCAKVLPPPNKYKYKDNSNRFPVGKFTISRRCMERNGSMRDDVKQIWRKGNNSWNRVKEDDESESAEKCCLRRLLCLLGEWKVRAIFFFHSFFCRM